MNRLSLLFSLFVFLPSLSLAQSAELSMEEIATYDSLTADETFYARVMENRSYCCQIWNTAIGGGYPFIDSISINDGSLDFLSDRAEFSPFIGAGNVPNSARQCFIASPFNTGENAFITIGIDSNIKPILQANLRCNQTTLFGGFNTVVTDFNFIEVTNTLIDTEKDDVIRFRITAVGTISGNTVLDRILTVEPGQRLDIDVHSTAGSDFGPVIIAHNGPPGSLRAINAQYRIVEAPFVFEPALSVGFREGL